LGEPSSTALAGDPSAVAPAPEPAPWLRPLGAFPVETGLVEFRVWAPGARSVEVLVRGRAAALAPAGYGVWEGQLAACAGDDYLYVLDSGQPLPDPCSRWQPAGSLGPSRVLDPSIFTWGDGDWPGLELEGAVLYELHVGCFTPEGTFEAIIPHLPRLRALGVTALELMPIATFPGRRNWGYDVHYVFAPHAVYGGPQGLARLVEAAHGHGLAVVLDVVYNHLGPGAESITAFAPYLSEEHLTRWGPAINYDGADSAGVREWAIQSAVRWVRDYHLDGLRLDATHAIVDASPRHILVEMAERVRRASPRRVALIAENSRNDPRVIWPVESGGWGLDAQWAGDFHHALHAALTGERHAHYEDFGSVGDVARAMRTPFVFAGQYSRFRRRPHGATAASAAGERFVVYAQNHDQVGNRPRGDRLPAHLRRLAAFCVSLSPYVPLLFMGEEQGAETPFLFFTDHQRPEIAQATRQGRRADFPLIAAHSEELPDSQDPEAFARSKVAWGQGDTELAALYEELLRLRRALPPGVGEVAWDEQARWLRVERGDYRLCCNFAAAPAAVPADGKRLLLATAPARLAGGAVHLPAWSGAVVR
jgi:maltooligosyltrehalose trehalohydrolase